MAIRRLSTVEDVIDAIGRDRVMKITRKRTNNVTNWLASGHFPPETFHAMTEELKARRCRAPVRLWRQIEAARAA